VRNLTINYFDESILRRVQPTGTYTLQLFFKNKINKNEAFFHIDVVLFLQSLEKIWMINNNLLVFCTHLSIVLSIITQYYSDALRFAKLCLCTSTPNYLMQPNRIFQVSHKHFPTNFNTELFWIEQNKQHKFVNIDSNMLYFKKLVWKI
jgi:hypothetical protein